MMSQAYRKSISMIIIQLYSKTLCATWKVLENAKCTWSSRVCICSICYLTIHLLSLSLKRKTNNNFTIMLCMTTVEGTRADGPLKHYVWLTLHIHIIPRSVHTCIRNVWRPPNDNFSLFRHELRHLPAEILALQTFLWKMVFLSSTNTFL